MKQKLYINNFRELYEFVSSLKHTKTKILICVKNGHKRTELIDYIQGIYNSSNIINELSIFEIRNNNDYICKVRLKDYKNVNTDVFDKKNITVKSSFCNNCSERNNCKFILDKRRMHKMNYKYEVIVLNDLVNKVLHNPKILERYEKVVFYKITDNEIKCHISSKEINKFLEINLSPKNNTKDRQKNIRDCTKAKKLTRLFFNNYINEKYLKELINALELIDEKDNYKKGYLIGKLYKYKVSNHSKITEVNGNITITFNLNI